jgi:hypothetical protein
MSYDVPPGLRAIFRAQHGLVTRTQALGSGLPPDVVDRLVARGLWLAVRQGIYSERSHWESLDSRSGQPRLEARAVYLGLQRAHLLSHDTAALFLGLATLKPTKHLVHVTRLGPPRARTRNGVRYHQSRLLGAHHVLIEGLPVLGLARTAVDIAREHGLVHGVVAIDAARQLGVGLAELSAVTEDMYRWPHVVRARTAVAHSDPGAESVGETLARLMLEELGLGPIQTQFEIRDASRWARCDLRVGRHLVEFDGHKKYQRRVKGGVATVDPEQVVWEEKKRQDWLLGYQLGMSRLVWSDFWGAARQRAMARVAREYELTCASFGTSIDDLSHVIVHRAA